MDDRLRGISNAVRSSEPDQVNDAIDQLAELDPDQKRQLFEAGFDKLTSIYEGSDDGYVRQSVVRVVDQLTPGLSAPVLVEDDANGVTATDVETRLDRSTGFLLEAIRDDDGRVRQSAKRALKDVYRGYGALEDTETVAALASELETLAEDCEGKRREDLLESKEDAEFLRSQGGNSVGERVRRLVGRSEDL